MASSVIPNRQYGELSLRAACEGIDKPGSYLRSLALWDVLFCESGQAGNRAALNSVVRAHRKQGGEKVQGLAVFLHSHLRRACIT